MSVELDPEPEPVSKLAFEDLRGTVLFRPESERTWTGPKGEVATSGLGSLGPGVSPEHDGRYDVVIGNPPWKTGVRLSGWDWVEDRVRTIASARVGPPAPTARGDGPEAVGGVVSGGERPARPAGDPSLLPNNALDLPFVWRAAEWARPGGQIAFALHGRLLFQQSDGMPRARASLLGAFDVTSIVNGAGLRQTQVWPNVTAPFCLVFARNAAADRSTAIRFVTPREEPRLNRVGAFRLDAANAPIVPAREIMEDPLVLKTLFRGSELDLEIRRRVSAAAHPTLVETVSRRGGYSGSGLQQLRPSSRTRKRQSEPGADVSYLRGKPHLQIGPPTPVIDVAALPPFEWERAHDPRDARTFEGPLLIVDKVARAKVPGFSAGFASTDVVFSENYYGYGLDDTPAGRDVAAHLAAVLRSKFARWWLLMTSGEYGFEREVVEKDAFDGFPVPAVQPAPQDGGETLGAWYVRQGTDLDQAALDLWVARLYGLSRRDQRIVDDTIRHAFARMPTEASTGDERGNEKALTDKSGRKTASKPGSLDIAPFLEGLDEELDPWEKRFDVDLRATPGGSNSGPTWRYVRLGRGVASREGRSDLDDFLGLVQAADETGSTEVYHQSKDGRLWIGLPEEERYWTFSQGLRSGRHVIWNHIDFLLQDRHDGD